MFLYTIGMFHMHPINPSIICWVRVGGDVTARCKQETTLQDSVSPFIRVKLMLLLILLMTDHEMPRDHRVMWRETNVWDGERRLLEIARPADSGNEKPLMKMARVHCLSWREQQIFLMRNHKWRWRETVVRDSERLPLEVTWEHCSRWRDQQIYQKPLQMTWDHC